MTSLVQAADLDPSTNHFMDVISKGFHVGESGLYFPCGVSPIKLEKSSGEILLLLSRVAVKKVETLPSSSLSESSIQEIAQSTRFDSIFVDDRGSEDAHPFRSNFVLLNQSQILPTHIVFVRYKDQLYGVKSFLI